MNSDQKIRSYFASLIGKLVKIELRSDRTKAFWVNLEAFDGKWFLVSLRKTTWAINVSDVLTIEIIPDWEITQLSQSMEPEPEG